MFGVFLLAASLLMLDKMLRLFDFVATAGGPVGVVFKMLANLSGGMAGGLTKVSSVGGATNGIPFSIQGTTSNPQFVPDMAGAAGSLATGAVKGAMSGKVPGVNTPANALGGLLGKKKK